MVAEKYAQTSRKLLSYDRIGMGLPGTRICLAAWVSRNRNLRRIRHMWKEFKDFAFKGNVFELAVAFVLGVAFAAVISSLVKDLIMPIVSLATGGLDFNNWFVALNGHSYATLADAQKAGAAT